MQQWDGRYLRAWSGKQLTIALSEELLCQSSREPLMDGQGGCQVGHVSSLQSHLHPRPMTLAASSV